MKLEATDMLTNPLAPTSEQQLIRWLWIAASGAGMVLMRVAQVGVLVWIILSAVVSAFVGGVKRILAFALAVVRFGWETGAYLLAKTNRKP